MYKRITMEAKLFVALLIPIVIGIIILCSCSSSNSNQESSSNGNSIRFLNFKPEIAAFMNEAAQAFEAETGMKVIVDTAANGQYETTLTSKMSSDEAPTLFVINGQNGYKAWKNYCADMTNTWASKHLTDKDMAVKDSSGHIYGVPYVTEGYGIIYNEAITNKYFALPDKKSSLNSMEEVKCFDELKVVAEDMQAHAEQLGIQGTFSSTSLKTGHDFRWQTHLANMPITQEFIDKDIDLTSDQVQSIEFKYSKNFQKIFDLFINNSIVPRKRLGTVAVTDSMAEFAMGRSAMVQNGNWSWSQIKSVKNKMVDANNIKFLPIYMDLPNEDNQGLCIGTENFYAINSKSTPQQQEIANKFIEWMYSSKTGKDYVVNKFGFIAPFDTFSTTDVPEDPLGKQLMLWMQNKNVKNVPWYFTVFPSQNFKNRLGASLLRYAQEQKDWDTLTQQTIDLWHDEYTSSLYD